MKGDFFQVISKWDAGKMSRIDQNIALKPTSYDCSLAGQMVWALWKCILYLSVAVYMLSATLPSALLEPTFKSRLNGDQNYQYLPIMLPTRSTMFYNQIDNTTQRLF